MSDIIEIRPPEVIAAEINQIKRSTAQYVLLQSIEIGRLLCEAKQSVPFGDWGGWLEANCAYSQSNANNLMRIYKEYGEDAQLSFIETNKLELYGNLNRSQAVALLALPSEEREEFVRANDVESMSVSQLEEAIKAAKAETEEKLARAEAERDEIAEKLRTNEDVKFDAIKRANDADKRSADMLAAQKKAEAAKDKAEKAKKAAEDKLSSVQADRDRLQVQIAELQNKKPEISAEEKAKIEAEAKAEYAKDLEYLAEQNKKLKAASDPTAQKFAAYFENFSETFNKMYRMFGDMDDEIQIKLKGALKRAVQQMDDKL